MVLSPSNHPPDVAYVSQDRLKIIGARAHGPPTWWAEVVSLEGRKRDRIEKRDYPSSMASRSIGLSIPSLKRLNPVFGDELPGRAAGTSRRDGQVGVAAGFEVSVNALFHGDDRIGLPPGPTPTRNRNRNRNRISILPFPAPQSRSRRRARRLG